MRKISLVLCALGLAACQANLPSKPIKANASKLDKTTQKNNAKEYQCKDGFVIRVVTVRTPKQKSKLDSINLTFNGVTQKLQPTISETGKNYANIRWIWQQRQDYSTLKTSVGALLAEQCVESSTAKADK